MASQIHAGLDGIARKLKAPPASESPYADTHAKLPISMEEALPALQQDSAMNAGFGADFIRYFCHIKQAELKRWSEAQDKMDWQRREYFSRF
jgi:glutamine synthetase